MALHERIGRAGTLIVRAVDGQWWATSTPRGRLRTTGICLRLLSACLVLVSAHSWAATRPKPSDARSKDSDQALYRELLELRSGFIRRVEYEGYVPTLPPQRLRWEIHQPSEITIPKRISCTSQFGGSSRLWRSSSCGYRQEHGAKSLAREDIKVRAIEGGWRPAAAVSIYSKPPAGMPAPSVKSHHASRPKFNGKGSRL